MTLPFILSTKHFTHYFKVDLSHSEGLQYLLSLSFLFLLFLLIIWFQLFHILNPGAFANLAWIQLHVCKFYASSIINFVHYHGKTLSPIEYLTALLYFTRKLTTITNSWTIKLDSRFLNSLVTVFKIKSLISKKTHVDWWKDWQNLLHKTLLATDRGPIK